MKKIPVTIKKSLQYAFSIIAGASTIAGILGYTLDAIENIDMNIIKEEF